MEHADQFDAVRKMHALMEEKDLHVRGDVGVGGEIMGTVR